MAWPRQIATARFEFKLTAQDQEDLRWYLEDFMQYPLDPAPKIAARIEQRMVEIGTTLFKDIFQSGDDARDLWATLRDRLDDTRVEIITEVSARDLSSAIIELTANSLVEVSYGSFRFGRDSFAQ